MTVDGGIQRWIVPSTGDYIITAEGAQGASGDPSYVGGKGAQVSGTFSLVEGEVLLLAVGQAGSGQSSGSNGGGGGGVHGVVKEAGSEPLIIAGGGGGTRTSVSQNGCDATVSQNGTTGSGGDMTWGCGERSSIGTGGIVSSGSWGSGGGGWLSDGAEDSPWGSPGGGGKSWSSGLQGGYAGYGCGDYAEGGFGGGGTGQGCHGGGGGGGYSGGDGGRVAGGGGSYNVGFDTSASAGVGEGHGFISIEAPAVVFVGEPEEAYSFGTCAAEGPIGPSESDCVAAYSGASCPAGLRSSMVCSGGRFLLRVTTTSPQPGLRVHPETPPMSGARCDGQRYVQSDCW